MDWEDGAVGVEDKALELSEGNTNDGPRNSFGLTVITKSSVSSNLPDVQLAALAV